jgi:hypothetical protein
MLETKRKVEGFEPRESQGGVLLWKGKVGLECPDKMAMALDHGGGAWPIGVEDVLPDERDEHLVP